MKHEISFANWRIALNASPGISSVMAYVARTCFDPLSVESNDHVKDSRKADAIPSWSRFNIVDRMLASRCVSEIFAFS